MMPLLAWAALAGEPQELFKQGRFDEALSACQAALEKNPNDAALLTLEGRVFLFENRLTESEAALEKARSLGSADPIVARLQAEVAFRRNDYAAAAGFFRKSGHPETAKQMEAFAGLRPYAVEGPPGAVSIPFVQTDPLPLIRAKVGGQEGYFLIDTGAAETVLDPKFAEQARVKAYGHEEGLFGGGKKSEVGLGKADSLELGPLTIRNLPVHLLDLSRLSAAALGREVSGIVGTGLFAHFQATLDYPHGALVLNRPDASPDGGAAAIPFWMAGDHYLVAWGRIDGSKEHLFFVDTGLAGGAFTGPDSIMSEIGIKPDTSGGLQGVGGGGSMTIAPFAIDRLALGPVERRNLPGIYGPFPPTLEQGLGFQLGGIISHQFFRTCALTFDFSAMKLRLKTK